MNFIAKFLPKAYRKLLIAGEGMFRSFDTASERDEFLDAFVDGITNGKKITIFISAKGKVTIKEPPKRRYVSVKCQNRRINKILASKTRGK